MAARRLIAILLVLLFLSSLAAALAPVQEGQKVVSSSTSTTSTTAEVPAPPEADAAEGPRLISQSLNASGGRPAVVRAKVGDQLQLRVTSQDSGTVELAGLGPTEDVGSEQPAYFDVLLRDDGSFPVRFLGTDDPDIARIEVSPSTVSSTDR